MNWKFWSKRERRVAVWCDRGSDRPAECVMSKQWLVDFGLQSGILEVRDGQLWAIDTAPVEPMYTFNDPGIDER